MTHEQAHAIALCEWIGIPWRYEFGAKEEWFGWNGKALNVATPPAPSGGNLIHEIAHWVVAPPERRELPDFGLGAIGFRNGAGDEESLASMLGILIERSLGLAWDDTWVLHEWSMSSNVFTTYRWLLRRGLVANGVPTCLMDATSARKAR